MVEDVCFYLVPTDHVALLVEPDMLPFFLLSMRVAQRAGSYRDVAYNDLLFLIFTRRVRFVSFDYSLTPRCPIECQ